MRRELVDGEVGESRQALLHERAARAVVLVDQPRVLAPDPLAVQRLRARGEGAGAVPRELIVAPRPSEEIRAVLTWIIKVVGRGIWARARGEVGPRGGGPRGVRRGTPLAATAGDPRRARRRPGRAATRGGPRPRRRGASRRATRRAPGTAARPASSARGARRRAAGGAGASRRGGRRRAPCSSRRSPTRARHPPGARSVRDACDPRGRGRDGVTPRDDHLTRRAERREGIHLVVRVRRRWVRSTIFLVQTRALDRVTKFRSKGKRDPWTEQTKESVTETGRRDLRRAVSDDANF